MAANQEQYLDDSPPVDQPIEFRPGIIPAGHLAHAGIFSPDMKQYYFTLSNLSLDQFTVMSIEKIDGHWTEPVKVFFDSPYLEHGVQFSHDGQWIYFSSTRPVGNSNSSHNWHIWRCEKLPNGWSQAKLVDLPDMADKTTSHPSFTHTGRMYFHSYHSDFSHMNLFMSDPVDGQYQQATRVEFPHWDNQNLLTAFVAKDESYLLFTKKFTDNHHEIFISFRDGETWQTPTALNNAINTNNLGNPFVTPDERFLFFASGHWPIDKPAHDWVIKWVRNDNLTSATP